MDNNQDVGGEVSAVDFLPAPNGWKKKFIPKKSGTPMRNEIIFISPTGEEIKNKRQLDQFLKAHPGGSLTEFDWNPGSTPRRSARISEKSKATESPENEPGQKRERKSSSKKEAKENSDDVAEEASKEEQNAAGKEIKESTDVEMKEAEGGEHKNAEKITTTEAMQEGSKAKTKENIPEKNSDSTENAEVQEVNIKNDSDAKESRTEKITPSVTKKQSSEAPTPVSGSDGEAVNEKEAKEEDMGKRLHATPTNTISKQMKNNQEKLVTPVASSSNQEASHQGIVESNLPTLVGKAIIFIPDPRTALQHCDGFVPVYGFPVAHDQVTRYKKLVEDHGHIASVDLISEINTLVRTTQIVLGVVEGIERLGDSLPSWDNLEAWGLCLGNARIMHFNVGWLDNILQTLKLRLNSRKEFLPAEIQGLKEEISRLQLTVAQDEAERGRLLLEIADAAGRIGTAKSAIAAARKSLEETEKELAALP